MWRSVTSPHFFVFCSSLEPDSRRLNTWLSTKNFFSLLVVLLLVLEVSTLPSAKVLQSIWNCYSSCDSAFFCTIWDRWCSDFVVVNVSIFSAFSTSSETAILYDVLGVRYFVFWIPIKLAQMQSGKSLVSLSKKLGWSFVHFRYHHSRIFFISFS